MDEGTIEEGPLFLLLCMYFFGIAKRNEVYCMLCAHTNRVIVNHSELRGLDGINNNVCLYLVKKKEKKN